MSCSQFIDQIQTLMHIQQIRYAEVNAEKSNYAWLSSKKCTLTFMPAKDEFLLRHAFQKVDQEQQTKALKQLLSWMEEHPHAQADKVPQMCISLLNRFHTINMLNQTAFSRMNSFRNSLKRLSIMSNKVAPVQPFSPTSNKRSVKFNDKPTVYCITE